MPAPADNKDIARRFYDLVWIKRDMAAAEPLIAPNCIRHDPSGPVPTGPAGFAAMVQKWRAAFSDLSLAIDFALAEGDLVAVRWTIHATHTGLFAGVPGSGAPVTFSGVNIFRIQQGRIAEIWNHRDDLSVYQQIGAL
jgi:steroid delta-isomerase-like uncharacterized protein